MLQNICCTSPYPTSFKELFWKRFSCLWRKKKIKWSALGKYMTTREKVVILYKCFIYKNKCLEWRFYFSFFFRNSHKCYWFKKNYQNKLLPSSMAWATPIIQVLTNVFLLLFLLQIERHEVLLLHISFGRSP